MEESKDYLEFRDRNQWRQWLEVHHAVESEAWLVIYKKKYRDLGLSLNVAVEEALCFGWIDGTLNSIDEKRYALRFSPRTENSIWSISNIHRVEKLTGEGKMTEAGRKKMAEAKESGEWEAAIRREQVDRIPTALESELGRVDGGIAAYLALPASRKKQYIFWLQSAKREETKQKRMQKILEEVLGQ